MHGQWICDEDFFSKISQIGNWPIWADEANKLCIFCNCVPPYISSTPAAPLYNINRSEKWGKKIQAAAYNGARTVYYVCIN